MQEDQADILYLGGFRWPGGGVGPGSVEPCFRRAVFIPKRSKPSVLEGHQERSFPTLVSVAGHGDSFVQAPKASAGDPGHLLKNIILKESSLDEQPQHHLGTDRQVDSWPHPEG